MLGPGFLALSLFHVSFILGVEICQIRVVYSEVLPIYFLQHLYLWRFFLTSFSFIFFFLSLLVVFHINFFPCHVPRV